MIFEEYLKSKNIDASAFERVENAVFVHWKAEFEQMHPNSFTIHKLNMINPVRRKYRLSLEVKRDQEIQSGLTSQDVHSDPTVGKPARPVIKSKPKIN